MFTSNFFQGSSELFDERAVGASFRRHGKRRTEARSAVDVDHRSRKEDDGESGEKHVYDRGFD